MKNQPRFVNADNYRNPSIYILIPSDYVTKYNKEYNDETQDYSLSTYLNSEIPKIDTNQIKKNVYPPNYNNYYGVYNKPTGTVNPEQPAPRYYSPYTSVPPVPPMRSQPRPKQPIQPNVTDTEFLPGNANYYLPNPVVANRLFREKLESSVPVDRSVPHYANNGSDCLTMCLTVNIPETTYLVNELQSDPENDESVGRKITIIRNDDQKIRYNFNEFIRHSNNHKECKSYIYPTQNTLKLLQNEKMLPQLTPQVINDTNNDTYQ